MRNAKSSSDLKTSTSSCFLLQISEKNTLSLRCQIHFHSLNDIFIEQVTLGPLQYHNILQSYYFDCVVSLDFFNPVGNETLLSKRM